VGWNSCWQDPDPGDRELVLIGTKLLALLPLPTPIKSDELTGEVKGLNESILEQDLIPSFDDDLFTPAGTLLDTSLEEDILGSTKLADVNISADRDLLVLSLDSELSSPKDGFIASADKGRATSEDIFILLSSLGPDLSLMEEVSLAALLSLGSMG
jgi:hypothetical protein